MGTVTLSIDAELGWGYHDLGRDPSSPRLRNARRGWRRLLDLFDEYEVPATWAVVGHLFLRDCDGEHPEHPAPPGWFAHERGPDAHPRDLRFADGLVAAIREAAVDHEIGLHTFSHVEFGDPATSAELARAEVRAGLEAARERGLAPTTLVFPRNQVGHRDVLAAEGIECYRGREPRSRLETRRVRSLRKLAWALGDGETPPLVAPRVDEHGLVCLPASLYLFGFEGVARSLVEPIRGDPMVRRAKNGVDAAADGGVCHLWLHPNDLRRPRDAERVRAVLEHVRRRRAEGAVTVETMADVADRTRTRPRGDRGGGMERESR